MSVVDIVAAIRGRYSEIWALAVARFIDTTGNGFFLVLLPAFVGSTLVTKGADGLGVFATGTLIGISVSVYGFVNGAFQAYTGRLLERYAVQKKLALTGLGVISVGSFLFVFAADYLWVITLRVVQGVGAALALPSSMAIVNGHVKDGNRGQGLSLFSSVRLLGYVVGPIMAGWILSNGPYAVPTVDGPAQVSGFTVGFVLASGLAGLSLLIVWTLVSAVDGQPATREETTYRIWGEGQLFHPLFALGTAAALVSVTVDIFVSLQPTINRQLGQGDFLFSVQYAILIAVGIVLLVPAGKTSDRYGRRPVLIAGAALTVPAVLVQGFLTSPRAMILARAVQGAAFAMVFAAAIGFAGDVSDTSDNGSPFAVITTGFVLGRAVGPLAGGVLVDVNTLLPFLVGTVFAVLSLLLIYLQVGVVPRSSSELARERPKAG